MTEEIKKINVVNINKDKKDKKSPVDKKLSKVLGLFADWEFCGNDYTDKGKEIWKWKVDEKIPYIKGEKCTCGRPIKKRYFIMNKKTKEIKLMGINCIEKFIPTKMLLSCIICGSLHNNSKYKLCKKCDVEEAEMYDCEYCKKTVVETKTKKHRCPAIYKSCSICCELYSQTTTHKCIKKIEKKKLTCPKCVTEIYEDEKKTHECLCPFCHKDVSSFSKHECEEEPVFCYTCHTNHPKKDMCVCRICHYKFKDEHDIHLCPKAYIYCSDCDMKIRRDDNHACFNEDYEILKNDKMVDTVEQCDICTLFYIKTVGHICAIQTKRCYCGAKYYTEFEHTCYYMLKCTKCSEIHKRDAKHICTKKKCKECSEIYEKSGKPHSCPIKEIKCQYCEKTYTMKAYLEAPESCEECNQRIKCDPCADYYIKKEGHICPYKVLKCKHCDESYIRKDKHLCLKYDMEGINLVKTKKSLYFDKNFKG